MWGLLMWANRNINVCTSNNSTRCVKRQQCGSSMYHSCFITALYTCFLVKIFNNVKEMRGIVFRDKPGRKEGFYFPLLVLVSLVFSCHSESIHYATCLRAAFGR